MHRINEIWPKWHGVEILGEGGFGTVYKAKKQSFAGEEYCAVKIINIPNHSSEIDEMTDSGFTNDNIKDYYKNTVMNLVSEIQMMSKFKTASHIVSIEDYEVVEQKNSIGYTIFIRMELLTNITKYFRDKEVTHLDVIKLGLEILTALEFCHSQNIMHRDIKPANIFINEFGEYKLGDFGISREVEKTNATLSQKGTKSYMAPEMIKMEKYGKNVDLYALGLTMYELLNHGRMPFLPPYPQSFFPQQREEAIIRRLSGEAFPELDAPRSLNALIKRACHIDKEKRYQTATEMKKDLLEIYNIFFGDISNYPSRLLDTLPTLSSVTLDDDSNTDLTIGKLVDISSISCDEKTIDIFNDHSLFENDSQSSNQNNGIFESKTLKQQKKISSEDKTLGIFNNKTLFNTTKNEFMFEDTTGILNNVISSNNSLENKVIDINDALINKNESKDLRCQHCHQKMYIRLPHIYTCTNMGTSSYDFTTKKVSYKNRCLQYNRYMATSNDPVTNQLLKLHQQLLLESNYNKKKDILNTIYAIDPNDYFIISYVADHYISIAQNDLDYSIGLKLKARLLNYDLFKKDNEWILVNSRRSYNPFHAFSEKTKKAIDLLERINKAQQANDRSLSNQLIVLYYELFFDSFNKPLTASTTMMNQNGNCEKCQGQLEEILPGILECRQCMHLVQSKKDNATDLLFQDYQDLVKFHNDENYEFEIGWLRRIYHKTNRDITRAIVDQHGYGIQQVKGALDRICNMYSNVYTNDRNLINQTRIQLGISNQANILYVLNYKDKDFRNHFVLTDKEIYYYVDSHLHQINYFELDDFTIKNSFTLNLMIQYKKTNSLYEKKMRITNLTDVMMFFKMIKKELYIK